MEKTYFKHEYDSSQGSWIIDTDPGIDDAFALTFAFNFLKDNLKLISIVSGNTGPEQCIRNAKKLCVINNRFVRISSGKELTLSTQSLRCFSGIHGSDGFFDFHEYDSFVDKYDNSLFCLKHSAIEIIKTINEHYNKKEKINLLTLGPLTNISIAYMLDPTIVDKLNKVVIMGGAYLDTGNISPSGEYNFACDNISAKIILNNFKNISVYSWEPSLKHLVYPEDIKVDNGKDKTVFIKKCTIKKMEWNQGGIYADLGAAVAAFYPKSITSSEKVYTDVVVDTEVLKLSRFIINKENVFDNKDKEIHEVVYNLNMEVFHELVNEMLI